jgi:Holliday junction resolvase RusA-like endonuclease
MAETLTFFVRGVPSAGGSKKAFVHPKTKKVVVVDDAKRNMPWREVVASVAREHFAGPPLDGPLAVAFTFVVQRPRGHFGSGRRTKRLKPSSPLYPVTRPDVLKLARSTEDALTGVIWRDDSCTVRLILTKEYGDQPGVRVEVQALDEDEGRKAC